jgi:RimJ/RimL family protein N-acetyltransferase
LGTGHGAEAARLTLDFAFRELNLYRVQATVFSYNARSQALFERLGFRHEGTFREFCAATGSGMICCYLGCCVRNTNGKIEAVFYQRI